MNNLRNGNWSWNSSVGENFDPNKWEVVDEVDSNMYVLCNENGIVLQPVPEGSREPGIYLTDKNDAPFIKMLLDIGAEFTGNLFSYFQLNIGCIILNQSQFIPYISSSQNKFSINSITRTSRQFPEISMYYLDSEGYIKVL